jgi:hypothetical protein
MRRVIIACVGLIVAVGAQSAERGSSGKASAAPPTKSAGPRSERAALPPRDLPIEPRHGLLAAPGAAPDALGPSRLGPSAPRTVAPSYGESAPREPRGGTISSTWHSGDRVRSPSSADVRLARQQEAPDLEFVAEAQGGARGQPAAVPARTQAPHEGPARPEARRSESK